MASELQQRKLTARFNLLDVDKNGYIDRADYEQMIERLGKAFSVDANSEAYQRVRDNYLNLWSALQRSADTNSDQRVTREEFVAAELRVADTRGGYDKILAPITRDVFNMVDVNGDGQVTEDEFTKVFTAYGVSEHDCVEAFRQLDRDQDHSLSLDEVQQAVRDFYMSDDPDTAGNWLFGPF